MLSISCRTGHHDWWSSFRWWFIVNFYDVHHELRWCCRMKSGSSHLKSCLALCLLFFLYEALIVAFVVKYYVWEYQFHQDNNEQQKNRNYWPENATFHQSLNHFYSSFSLQIYELHFYSFPSIFDSLIFLLLSSLLIDCQAYRH